MTQETIVMENKEALVAFIKNPIKGAKVIINFTSLAGLATKLEDPDLLNNPDLDIGNWDVSNVTDMSWLFGGARNFNQPLDKWNVSNVKNMAYMFYDAEAFNQPLNNWDVGNVKNMSDMFMYTENFNQPLNKWNVSNVKDMYGMFRFAKHFSQSLNSWNVSNVKDMALMFMNAVSFKPAYMNNKWKIPKTCKTAGMYHQIP
jgi:surface protein